MKEAEPSWYRALLIKTQKFTHIVLKNYPTVCMHMCVCNWTLGSVLKNRRLFSF